MIVEMFGMLLEEVKDTDENDIVDNCDRCALREICDILTDNNKSAPCNVTGETRATADRHFVEVKLYPD